MTQPIGQNFHHMRRKMRRLLNEKVKPATIDLSQLGGTPRHSVYSVEQIPFLRVLRG